MNFHFTGSYITEKTLNTNDHSKLYETTEIECNKRYITFVGSGHYKTSAKVTKNFEYTGVAYYPVYDENGIGVLNLHDELTVFWTDTFNSKGTERGKRHKTIIRIDGVDGNGRVIATSKISDCWIEYDNKTIHSVPNGKHGFGSFVG